MTDIDDILRPGDDNSTNSRDVWDATAKVLRRRRYWRRGKLVAVMAFSFVAGSLVMYRPIPQVAPTVPTIIAAVPEEVETPREPEAFPESPKRLERWASSRTGEKRRTLYRDAGDGYLKNGDEVAAVRCYRKALDGGSPPELAVRVEDTWLMMSLKVARNKE